MFGEISGQIPEQPAGGEGPPCFQVVVHPGGIVQGGGMSGGSPGVAGAGCEMVP